MNPLPTGTAKILPPLWFYMPVFVLATATVKLVVLNALGGMTTDKGINVDPALTHGEGCVGGNLKRS